MYAKDLEGLTLEEALDVVLGTHQGDKAAAIKEALLAAPRKFIVQRTGLVGPPAVTALETKYAGIRFRSRIEARWAVFMDKLGIVWWYEKEGLNLGGEWYLPDFWLPQLNVYMEIKGAPPTDKEMNKAALLNTGTEHDVFIFYGDIPRGIDWYYEQSPGALKFDHGCDFAEKFFWTLCRKCFAIGITEGGRTDLMCGCGEGHYTTLDERRLEAAYDAARSERFGT